MGEAIAIHESFLDEKVTCYKPWLMGPLGSAGLLMGHHKTADCSFRHDAADISDQTLSWNRPRHGLNPRRHKSVRSHGGVDMLRSMDA